MPVFEETVQFAFDCWPQQPRAQPAEWQLILDAVFEITCRRPVLLEHVRVLPAPEGAANLDVSKLPVPDVAAVLCDPAHARRPVTDRELYAPAIRNSARLRHHAHRLSGRRQLLEGSWQLVPSEYPFHRSRNARATDE